MTEKIIRQPNTEGKLEDGYRVMQGRQEYVTYPDGSTFRVWYSDTPWRYEAHTHSAVEMILMLDGQVEFDINGKNYTINKDEVLIIPSGMSHGLNMGEGGKRLLYLFEPDALNNMRDFKDSSESFDRVFHLKDETEAQKKVREKLLKIQDIFRTQDFMWNTECYAQALSIFAILGKEFLSLTAPHYTRVRSCVESEIISGALTYINNHYKEDLTLDELADFAGFSRYYFSRSFKKEVGRSFKDYLCGKRLQVAMDLLIHTRRPIRDVAVESGFGSIASFNRSFRESKNCTPTQYRAIYGVY